MEDTKKISDTLPEGETLKPSNSIEIEANPMLTASSASGVKVRVQLWLTTSRKYTSMTLSFVGAPQIVEGWGFNVRDLSSTSQSDYSVCMPTRISCTYDGGFSMTAEARFPSDNTAYSSSFNSSTTLLTYTKELAYGRANQAAYSTDEQVTGQKWIDGKPIYRKVFTGTTTSTGTVTVASLGASVGTMISMHGAVLQSSNSRWYPVPYADNDGAKYSYGARYDISDGNLKFSVGSSRTGSKTYHIIVEYTKTTD